MPAYKVEKTRVFFRQRKFPAQWMKAFYQLGVPVELTGSRMYPFSVILTESEFISCLEIAEEL